MQQSLSTLMDQSLSTLYARYRTLALLVVAGTVMLLSFLWYLPGAYHASTADEYHLYSWRAFKFNNIVDMYVGHDLYGRHGLRFILGGPGIEYPALLSTLIRSTASIGPSDGVPIDVYRSGSAPRHGVAQNTATPLGVAKSGGSSARGNVPTYLLVNDAVIFLFGLLAIMLLARWRGARPWLFAVSPILLLFTGYNWDLVPIALILAAFLLFQRSTERPSPGRGYNMALEVAAFALLTCAVWFKLFPIVFLGAALIDRARWRLWQAVGYGLGVFAVLSVLINLPLMVANYDNWRFFLWINTNRPIEPSSIWYLLFGARNLGLTGRPDTTAAATILSLFVVVAGGLAIVVLAWRGPRRAIMMPLGCLLLLWWFTFNKVYDPNFDLWLLFILAVLGAPFWLNAALVPLSLFWYVTAIGGLALSTLATAPGTTGWYVSHVLMFTIVLRLVVLGTLLFWVRRELLTAERALEFAPVSQP